MHISANLDNTSDTSTKQVKTYLNACRMLRKPADQPGNNLVHTVFMLHVQLVWLSETKFKLKQKP